MALLALKLPALEADGATLTIRVFSATKPQKPGGIPSDAAPLCAMIDTGSSTTVLKQGVPSFLGLKARSNTLVSTASSSQLACDEFAVILILGAGFQVRTTALELPLGTPGIDCLIGRDVLAQSVMTYIGPENQVILSF